MPAPPVLVGADQRALAVTAPPGAPASAVPMRGAPGLVAVVRTERLTRRAVADRGARQDGERVRRAWREAGERVAAAVRAEGDEVPPSRATYAVIAEPPSANGSCQPTVIVRLVAEVVRATPSGATGSAHVVVAPTV